jgi:hypothetical protein
MDAIEGLCNRVVTECGHAFHCSCLMQNTAHNGFGCPYCRTKMAEEPKEEDESDYGYSDDETEVTVFDSDALTSFRMFHQQLNGEEVEEEEGEEWATIDGDEENEEAVQMPDAAYIAQKLTARGITFEDLVKNILFQEHSNNGEHYTDYENTSSIVYGQFCRATTEFVRTHPAIVPAPIVPAPIVPAPIAVVETGAVILPIVAESKSASLIRASHCLIDYTENYFSNI